MAIGIPVSIVTNIFTTLASPFSTNGTANTNVDAPAGSLNLVYLFRYSNTAITAVTDSGGNTYQAAVASGVNSATEYATLWYCSNTPNDLPSNGFFTVTYSGSGSAGLLLGAATVTGCNGGLDQVVGTAAAIGNGTTGTLTTGTLSQANELVLSWLDGVSNFTSYTDNFTGKLNGTFSQPWQTYLITNATTPVTWTSNWSNSTDYAAVVATFKATASAAVSPIGLAWSEC